MTNYKEIIRLHSLGLNKTRIAESCDCARSTVITALHKAEENGLSWNAVKCVHRSAKSARPAKLSSGSA